MKLSNEEKYVFCGEMEMILSSGLDLGQGLLIVKDNMPSQSLKDTVQTVYDQFLLCGEFSQAIAQSEAFDYYMEQMVNVGQASGHLDQVMKELALYYERQQKMNRQIKEAMTYPLVLVAMMFVIVGIIIFKVLPIFQSILQSLGSDLSSFAYGLMNFGHGLASVAFFLLALFILIGVLAYFYMRKHNNTMILSRFFLTKKLYQDIAIAQMTYALSLFISSGYPLDQSFSMIKDFVSHPVLKEKITHVLLAISQGENFADALLKERIYSGIYANMLAIGIQVGKQDEVLKKLGSLYEEEVEHSTSRFLNIIEPTIIAALSLIVGIILLSIMLPLMSIMSSL